MRKRGGQETREKSLSVRGKRDSDTGAKGLTVREANKKRRHQRTEEAVIITESEAGAKSIRGKGMLVKRKASLCGG